MLFHKVTDKFVIVENSDIPENGTKQYMSWTRRRCRRVAAMTGVSDDGFQAGFESEISSTPGSGVPTSAH